jgi:hypothetical protein
VVRSRRPIWVILTQLSTWDQHSGNDETDTCVGFIQHDTANPQRTGVAHGAATPCMPDGSLFPLYQNRHSLEFRDIAYGDYSKAVLQLPLRKNWMPKIAPNGRRYYVNSTTGDATWVRPFATLHADTELFPHRQWPERFHPPSAPVRQRSWLNVFQRTA